MDGYEKRGYLLESFRLFHLRTEQAPTVNFHYHEFCKLLFLVSGSGKYVVQGHRYLLQSGDVVLIDSRSVHRPEMNADTPYERIIIYISPEFLQRESTGECRLLECFSGQQGHVLRMKEPARKRLFAMVEALEGELNHDDLGRDIASNAALLRMLVQIAREKSRESGQGPQPVQPKNKRILEIMEYLEAHLEEDLSIDTLSEQFYISRYHMMRLFRRETGDTIYDYLLQRRLLRARELMMGGMPATEACYRSGFRSYSSFTRSYSKHFGSTPTGRMDSIRRREEGYE